MNRIVIKELVDELVDKLPGDWVLLGGSLLSYLNISDRQTYDIDLAPKGKISNDITLAAMEIASKKGMPPEAINFSVAYFLKKQRSWESELILIRKTKSSRLFRPTKKLFRKLKEARGTETDIRDIELYESGVEDR